ncbi:MAG: hypothetical protein A2X58_08150 [Nitrospirae bacterium GWC2_56_14]|nr:MAG: hypothetical protein A2X58_08150 [Nitrospirae bacterium GWC2_56_14]
MKNILVVIFVLMLLCRGAAAADFRFSPKPNKAHLIHWRAWGPEALDEAKKQDRLVLLSLSAVWCHWCHVMDETTYSNEEIIAFINDHFLPIRVDSDMRPDIDALYNQGGWPSTVIMTPQGEVLTGGTYIPPDDLLGRMKQITDIFQHDRGTITGWLEETRVALAKRDLSEGESAGAPAPGEKDLGAIVKSLADVFDEQHGGFGTGQKFPSPESLDFLLARYSQKQDPLVKRIVTTTLDHMAKGGLFDEVEGGFFRYATKPDWSEPHYEKMLDLNAGMIRNYAEASLVFGSKEYEKIVRTCVHYVRQNLYDASTGAFFGSQDADEAYYTSENRKGLTAPAVDRTVYADSSALMISALVSAYGAVGEQQYLDMARKAADYLLADLFVRETGFYHFSRSGTRSLEGLLSDNVLVGSALLDLYNATGEKRYLIAAKEINALLKSRFYDAAAKRFRPSLAAPLATPIVPGILSSVNHNLANYRALRFMGRVLAVEESQDQKKIRDEALAAFRGTYQEYTPNAAAYGSALLGAVENPIEITIIGKRKAVRSYLAAIRDVYVPNKVVRVLSVADDGALIKKLGYPKRETVYLCAGKRCSKPITDQRKLKEELRKFLERNGGT